MIITGKTENKGTLIIKKPDLVSGVINDLQSSEQYQLRFREASADYTVMRHLTFQLHNNA